MVDLVANDDVIAEVLNFAKRSLAALEVIERSDDPRLGRPGICAEIDRLPDFMDTFAVEDLEVETKLGVHLVPPLIGDS